MLHRTTLAGAIIWTFIQLQRIEAQNGFTSSYYQISGGEYTECCGFAGPFVYPLPDDNQAAIELIIDPDGTTARLTFLAPDMFTVFTSYPVMPGTGFPFTFDRGIVSSNYIRFTSGAQPPAVPLASWSYSVTNLNGGLGINGKVVTQRMGSDLPNEFMHTNVVATRILNAIVIDQVQHGSNTIQFHFTGPPSYDYTVESTTSLSSPDWQQIGTYRAKLQTIDVTITRSLSTAQTRFYRVRQQPCGCR